MLDIRFIRENSQLVKESAQAKGYDIDIAGLLKADEERRNVLTEIESRRQRSNEIASANRGGKPPPGLIEEAKKQREKISELEAMLDRIDQDYTRLLSAVPNLIPEDTPPGGEENNKQIKVWGETVAYDFEVKDHLSWAEEHGLVDFERGAKVAGNKFYYLKGALVDLELAVTNMGMELAKKHGFMPMLVPHMVNTKILEGAGFSARGQEKQIYKIEEEDLNLIATAEIPLTGYHAAEILPEANLPIKYAGLSPAYRVEGGAYGKYNRGLFRTHQFNKLELYVFCKPDQSEDWHQKMVGLEEEFCQQLEIPYRVVRIAAGDMGAPAYKKFDIEYRSPADKAYRELMSCSNVTDYQARRLNIRYKDSSGETKFVHTLNGTLAAMSRLPIAIIENFQDSRGNVHIPKSLQPYMYGQEQI